MDQFDKVIGYEREKEELFNEFCNGWFDANFDETAKNVRCSKMIVIPLTVPALLAQGLLSFIAHYNAYLGPRLYLKSRDLATLQLVVANFKDAAKFNHPAVMACCIVTILPILILYTVFQKYFVEGIATTGMKL